MTGRGSIRIGGRALGEMVAHACAEYPNECCGVIVRQGGTEVVRRWTNIQDAKHAEDPEGYPRTARIAYYVDPREIAASYREVDAGTITPVAFYHSHPDHDAYFSHEDEERALFAGEPLHPETAYLVISVRGGTLGPVRGFCWNPESRRFEERPVEAVLEA